MFFFRVLSCLRLVVGKSEVMPSPSDALRHGPASAASGLRWQSAEV